MDKLADAIASIEQYSYIYNIKMTGIPQKDRESANDTATLCLNLFASLGATEVTINDIDTAHRVPKRQTTNKPNPIICKFARRLAKDQVMACRRNVRRVQLSHLGIATSDDSGNAENDSSYIGIFDHLTPSLQTLLYEAKAVQAKLNFKYCWSKSSAIFLREDDATRVFKLQKLSDLESLQNDILLKRSGQEHATSVS